MEWLIEWLFDNVDIIFLAAIVGWMVLAAMIIKIIIIER